MRELKFRAWDKAYKQMSPEFVLFGEFTLLGAVHDWQWEITGKGPGEIQDYSSLLRLNDLEVMQYTGLNDRNSREMYEGDICRIHFYHNKTSVIGVMEWLLDASFCIRADTIYSPNFKSGGGFGDYPAVEVIGNIYETPELINHGNNL